MKVKQTVPFKGTKEQEQELRRFMAAHEGQPGAVLPVMQKAKEIYGYLPLEVQQMIAEGTGQPVSAVYGIATFYSQFNLQPKGKYQISVCLGTACYVKGSGDILARIEEYLGISSGECTSDGKFSIDACRCIGACGMAPVMTINNKVYGRLTPDEAEHILDQYRQREEAGGRSAS